MNRKQANQNQDQSRIYIAAITEDRYGDLDAESWGMDTMTFLNLLMIYESGMYVDIIDARDEADEWIEANFLCSNALPLIFNDLSEAEYSRVTRILARTGALSDSIDEISYGIAFDRAEARRLAVENLRPDIEWTNR